MRYLHVYTALAHSMHAFLIGCIKFALLLLHCQFPHSSDQLLEAHGTATVCIEQPEQVFAETLYTYVHQHDSKGISILRV